MIYGVKAGVESTFETTALIYTLPTSNRVVCTYIRTYVDFVSRSLSSFSSRHLFFFFIRAAQVPRRAVPGGDEEQSSHAAETDRRHSLRVQAPCFEVKGEGEEEGV